MQASSVSPPTMHEVVSGERLPAEIVGSSGSWSAAIAGRTQAGESVAAAPAETGLSAASGSCPDVAERQVTLDEAVNAERVNPNRNDSRQST
jgi:hypothetical protein